MIRQSKSESAYIVRLVLASMFLATAWVSASAQTNTFPASGNAGVGTTTPTLQSGTTNTMVEVKGPVNPGVGLTSTAAGGRQYFVYSSQANPGYFSVFDATAGADRFVISNSGNVGIGTNLPGEKLHISGNAWNDPSNAMLMLGPNREVSFQRDPRSGLSYAGWLESNAYLDASGIWQLRNTGTSAILAGIRPGIFDIWTSPSGSPSWTQQFSVTNTTGYFAGNVGIGITTPSAKLYVAGGGYGAVGGANQSAYALGAQSIAADASIYSYGAICSGNQFGNCSSSGGVVIGINNIAAATNIPNAGNTIFNNGGNVGIGLTAPAYKLDVNGEINATGIRINGTAISGGGSGSSQWTTAGSNIYYNSGNVGIGTTDPSLSGAVASRFTVTQADASTGFSLGNTAGTPRFALNGNSNGTWTMWDYGSGVWTAGITQRNGSVGIGTNSPVQGKLVISDTAQNASRLTFAGQEFYAPSMSSTDGVAFLLGVNRPGNKQLWIADSSALAQNSTNAAFRAIVINGAVQVDAIGTDGVTSKILNVGNNAGVSMPGNVGIGTSPTGYKLDVNGEINATGIRINGTPISGGGSSQWTGSPNIYYNSGNVGIGTANPLVKLDVNGTIRGGGYSAGAGNINSYSMEVGGPNPSATNGVATIFFHQHGVLANQLRYTNGTLYWEAAGNGYGTTAQPNLVVGGSINAKYQDLAEWVPSSEQLSAGTVVVLDITKSNQVVSSSTAYDTRVAGVISAQPGITLGESGEGKVLVATTGRVRVRVDASRAPIQIGDLLVTSDVAGVAMKSEAVNLGDVQIHRPGTIIGKALEPLAKGQGEILVLLSLQ